MNPSPLILTLQLDQESQHYFTTLRKEYFPAQVNFLDAHVTLFHQLPSNNERIVPELENAARIPRFAIQVTDIYHTGFGVAYRLQSSTLVRLHGYLQEAFYSWLTPQDRRPYHPHVTIQNKASAAESKLLAASLQQDFTPSTVTAIGLNTWLYKNGSWEHVNFFGFQAEVVGK